MTFGLCEALALAYLETRKRRLGPVQKATLQALRELRDLSRKDGDAVACLTPFHAAGSRGAVAGSEADVARPEGGRAPGGRYEVSPSIHVSSRGRRSSRLTPPPPVSPEKGA